MRKILFRGKRVDNGKWILGSLIKVKIRNAIAWIIFKPDFAFTDGGVASLGHANVDPETVGQCTGKKDENGKLIFEGDIGNSIDGLFLVCWDEEKAAFVMRFYSYPYETLYLEEMLDDCKIIGNIHDNPELLEGGEQK